MNCGRTFKVKLRLPHLVAIGLFLPLIVVLPGILFFLTVAPFHVVLPIQFLGLVTLFYFDRIMEMKGIPVKTERTTTTK